MGAQPSGSSLHTIRRSGNRFGLFKPVWSPDGQKFLVGCFDVRAHIDKLCVMNANGRNLHIVVATPDPVNFPAWGNPSTPRRRFARCMRTAAARDLPELAAARPRPPDEDLLIDDLTMDEDRIFLAAVLDA